jgi:ABC-2 type transport system permease protein
VTPGLLGWAIATSATFGAAATLVGWRRTKLLRRLRLAPVTTRSVVAARIGVTVTIALVQMLIFVGLAVALFGLRLSGSWWMSVPLLICGTLSFMALGLLAGAVSKTVEGATALANIFVLPMAFLSGSFFPLDGAPKWLDIVSHVLPLRHLNDGMLDVMVRGKGPSAALAPMSILLGFTVVILLVASRFFSWESD